MTKSQVINEIVGNTGLTRKQVASVMEELAFKPGETMNVAAKPAQTVVKVRPLKRLKDMAGS
jgi:nucleoid DNA-binding protein